jgi:branched-chain amino acid transport system permease protein
MLGAALLGYLKFLLGQQSLIDNTFILGAILVVAVLLLPQGIFPMIAGWWKRAFRRKPRPTGLRRKNGRARRARHAS